METLITFEQGLDITIDWYLNNKDWLKMLHQDNIKNITASNINMKGIILAGIWNKTMSITKGVSKQLLLFMISL